jgi:hypothetical protein
MLRRAPFKGVRCNASHARHLPSGLLILSIAKKFNKPVLPPQSRVIRFQPRRPFPQRIPLGGGVD